MRTTITAAAALDQHLRAHKAGVRTKSELECLLASQQAVWLTPVPSKTTVLLNPGAAFPVSETAYERASGQDSQYLPGGNQSVTGP